MFEKLNSFWNLLKVGQEVSNVEFWKGIQSKGQPVVAALLMSIVALTKGTKYEIPMDNDTALLIGGGIFATINWILTNITSKRVGFSSSNTEGSGVSDKPVQATMPVNQQVQQSEAPMQAQDSNNTITTISEVDIARARAFVAGNKPFDSTKITGG